MLRSAKDLRGFTIVAKDGAIGDVAELYFDDDMWTIRYVVVDTGGWLTGRRVLISPIAVKATDADGKSVRVTLTKEQVKNSPDIDTDKPVSRQREIEYFNYYGWPYYWAGPALWGGARNPSALSAANFSGIGPSTASQDASPENLADSHLRSTKEVAGYDIEATDGEIGHAEDFIIDDVTWAIRYLVVDTVNWWPGKKVLVSPQWVAGVNWAVSKVYVNLLREEIKSAPEFNPHTPLEREYEERLYRHYRHPMYFF